MGKPNTAYASRWMRAFILWGSGWHRRRHMRGSSAAIEWQDPHSGLWYGDDAAIRLVRVQHRTRHR
ncbi:MAG: hypothetical protein ACREWG_13960 [Gammaproteobacteria bacterium]